MPGWEARTLTSKHQGSVLTAGSASDLRGHGQSWLLSFPFCWKPLLLHFKEAVHFFSPLHFLISHIQSQTLLTKVFKKAFACTEKIGKQLCAPRKRHSSERPAMTLSLCSRLRFGTGQPLTIKTPETRNQSNNRNNNPCRKG